MAQEKQWYYVKNNQQFGPISQQELLQLFQPQLSHDTPVWTQGMENWTPAQKVDGLIAVSQGHQPPSIGSQPPQRSKESQTSHQTSPTSESISPDSSAWIFAGFWIRFLAYLLDSLLVGIVYGIFGGILFGIYIGTADSGLPPIWAMFLMGFLALILVVATVLYYPLMESSKHQGTIGKKICGLKIIDINGNKISFGLSFGRMLVKGVTFPITSGVGWILAGLTLRKQAFHDKIVDTYVIKA